MVQKISSNRIRGIVQALVVLVIQFFMPDINLLLLKQVGPEINIFGSFLFPIVKFLIFIWPLIAVLILVESVFLIIFRKNFCQFFRYAKNELGIK